MKYHAEGAQRTAIIDGLHDLADWLAANPDVPVRRWGIEIQDRPGDGQEGVRRLAAEHDLRTEDVPGGCRTTKRFGPTAYVLYARDEQAQDAPESGTAA